MKICVFGLWHLGCVTAACLADLGFDITGLDLNGKTIDSLKKGTAPLYEPGLNDLINRGLSSGRLSFSTEPSVALSNAEVLWVTFDTPVNDDDVADVKFVEDNIKSLIPFVEHGSRIIISSQVPVGFTRRIGEKTKQICPDKTLHFAYSPENLRLGKAIRVFLEPDRIVVGTLPEEKALFSPVFSSISDRLEWMSIESAEMTKHAINAFLAASICFANEIAVICEHVGANAKEVERGLKTEGRIGQKAYLGPGVAFSGGTLARDIAFLSELGADFNLPLHLIKSVKRSNDFHRDWIKSKCLEFLGVLKDKKVAVLGLTYKPDTDTLRRSLSVELCKWLKGQGVEVKAFDPAIRKTPDELDKILRIGSNVKDVIDDADCVIVATEWQIFRELDAETISAMSGKTIIDPNGFIEEEVAACKDINYIAVGKR